MQKKLVKKIVSSFLALLLLSCSVGCHESGTEIGESSSADKVTTFASPETETVFLSDETDAVVSPPETTEAAISEESPQSDITDHPEESCQSANVRVMSWNLLMETKEYPVNSRSKDAIAVIRNYAPDVIGTQETSAEWYRDFARYLRNEYTAVTNSDETGGENYSTLWYRKDTVKVIEFGVKNYAAAAVKRMRIVTWAVFEHLDSGARFIVTSTHWDREVESPEGSNITFQAAELANLLRTIRDTYPVPTFCTGDYNRTPDTPQYGYFLELTGFGDAYRDADFSEGVTPTYHTVGSTELRVGLIDHIFCSPESRVLYYNTVTDPSAITASDHCPIYIDVDLSDDLDAPGAIS